VLEKLLLDRVAVEAGDRAQPARDGCAWPPASFHVATEALDVRPPRPEQVQAMLLAPGGEHPQVKRVRAAGQSAVAGEEAG
jgi:hypothetical protein